MKYIYCQKNTNEKALKNNSNAKIFSAWAIGPVVTVHNIFHDILTVEM